MLPNTTAAVIESPAIGDRAPNRNPDFRALLGPAAWSRLPAAVQARFAHASATACYVGTMDVVRLNWAGRILALLCRLIGTPLAPYTGSAVAMQVRVYEHREGGIVWERHYRFGARAPVVVRSIKRLDGDGSLLECLGRGLHMRLDVTDAAGVLRFVSRDYFLALPGLRLRWPVAFPPGITVVEHEDLGNGVFRFSLAIRHRWLGELCFQTGSFSNIGETS